MNVELAGLDVLSPPTRGRGLKLLGRACDPAMAEVAPYAGAWIETIIPKLCAFPPSQVAPYAGAWIETVMRRPGLLTAIRGRPLRGGVD